MRNLLERENVVGQTAALNHIAYYAGAVAFMFLLFAAAQNAVGILDDQAAGILDRIAAGPGGMTVVMNGRFIFLILQGMVQGTVIFAVAWLLYGVDVPGNFGAWLLISFSAAVLAAGLGLLLVTACRTRAQAQILPTVVILIMSAVGGSMVPRFFMPGWLQTLGLDHTQHLGTRSLQRPLLARRSPAGTAATLCGPARRWPAGSDDQPPARPSPRAALKSVRLELSGLNRPSSIFSMTQINCCKRQ